MGAALVPGPRSRARRAEREALPGLVYGTRSGRVVRRGTGRPPGAALRRSAPGTAGTPQADRPRRAPGAGAAPSSPAAGTTGPARRVVASGATRPSAVASVSGVDVGAGFSGRVQPGVEHRGVLTEDQVGVRVVPVVARVGRALLRARLPQYVGRRPEIGEGALVRNLNPAARCPLPSTGSPDPRRPFRTRHRRCVAAPARHPLQPRVG